MLLSIVTAAVAAAALAQPAINGLQPTGRFVLEIGGQPAEGARIYQSSSPPAVLVVSNSAQMPDPVLLQVSSGAVQTVNLLQMAERPGGVIDLLPGAGLEPQPNFAIDGVDAGLEVRFAVNGVPAVLKPKPPLLGERDAAELLRHSPEYAVGAAAYQPSAAEMERLRSRESPATVRVFFGSWCSACSQLLPLVLKVEKELEGAPVRFEYYGLPQGKAFSEDPEAARFEITGVPTGVVLVNGREVGRLKGESWRSPERSIDRILSGS